jgi:BirA family biotin operon repressor/biotin-[acetyl-CoA-carboxylase] ligase
MNALNEDILHKLLPNKRIVYLPSCHSTNALALEGVSKGTINAQDLVITPIQTSGKGQRGNTWFSEPHQNLTFSLVYDSASKINFQHIFDLNMLVSLGILEALKLLKINPIGLKIKWPNDIFFNNQKIGGILIENKFHNTKTYTSVIGIGLNVNQKDFKRLNASSIAAISGFDYDLNLVISTLVKSIDIYFENYTDNEYKNLYNKYLNQLYLFDKQSFFSANESIFEGKIIGLTREGNLQIQTVEGEIKLFGIQDVKFL